jgi:hypothetical protein
MKVRRAFVSCMLEAFSSKSRQPCPAGTPITSPSSWYMKRRTRKEGRFSTSKPDLALENGADQAHSDGFHPSSTADGHGLHGDTVASDKRESDEEHQEDFDMLTESDINIAQGEETGHETREKEPDSNESENDRDDPGNLSTEDAKAEEYAEESEEEIWLSKETLQHVFRSSTSSQIPLLEERLACLHEAGKVIYDVDAQILSISIVARTNLCRILTVPSSALSTSRTTLAPPS